ncbi:hypothetical protein AKO1_011596 [Acrasis kona]|uniref:Uncharacterized protein n=1 Tax=Acrasis kona TaxID=1008807 RepID=A0AAW2Z5M1_9EUKA
MSSLKPTHRINHNRPHQLFSTPKQHAQQCLFVAVTMGQTDQLTEMLKDPENIQLINGQDYLGRTPLMIAISSSNTAMCQLLLSQKNININLKTYLEQKNALIMASERGLKSVVQILLTLNAVVDDVDLEHKTALMHAVENGSSLIVSILLDAKSGVNLRDVNGRTALIYSVKNRSFNLLSKPNLKLIKCLLKAGALTEIKDKSNKDVLDYVEEPSKRTELSQFFDKTLKKYVEDGTYE